MSNEKFQLKTNENKWVAGIYARVSTDHDDQQTSKSHQIQFFDEGYCASYNIDKIQGYYIEENMTGTKTDKRTEFQRLIKDAHNNVINCVIAKSISRFARNQVDTIKIIRELGAKGVRFIFIEQAMDTIKDTQMLGLFAWMAEEESRTISKRRRFGGIQAAKNGHFTLSKPPLGYKIENKKLSIVEEEAVIVREVFDMFVSGMGTLRIAAAINSDGKRSRFGNKFGKSRINYILKNEAYKGWIVFGKRMNADVTLNKSISNSPDKWIVTKNAHPPIIEETVFDKVQDMFKDKGFTMSKKSVSIFAGVVRCKECGSAMARNGSTKRIGKTYFYYKCVQQTDMGRSNCDSISIREDHLKDMLDKIISNTKINVNFIKKYKEDGLKILKEKFEIKNDEKTIDKKILQLDKLRSTLTDKYLSGKIKDEMYELKDTEFSEELKKLISEKTKLSQNDSLFEKFSVGVDDYLQTIIGFTNIDDIDNYTVRKLVDKVFVSKNGNVDFMMKINLPKEKGNSMDIDQTVKTVGYNPILFDAKNNHSINMYSDIMTIKLKVNKLSENTIDKNYTINSDIHISDSIETGVTIIEKIKLIK